MLTSTETIIIAAILIVFSAISYQKKFLDFKGIIFADLIGIVASLFGGISAFTALIIFYAVAETSTRISKNNGNKHEKRSISNIIGNSGAAIIALVLQQPIAFFGAISAALADTISSEIGMLSKKQPRLITTLKKVETGTDGGVTLLGFAAAGIASLAMGTLYYFTVNESFKILLIISCAGFFGSIIDSLLGAIFETRQMLTNTQVNFLASSSGAILAFLLSTFI